MLAGRTGSSLATRLDLKLPRRGEGDETRRDGTRRGQVQRGGKSNSKRALKLSPWARELELRFSGPQT